MNKNAIYQDLDNNSEVPENFRIGSIRESIGTRLDGVLQIAKGLLKFPFAPIVAIQKYVPLKCSKVQKEIDQIDAEETATHECGHMFVDLFRGSKVSGMFMTTNGPLRSFIGMPKGVTISDSPLIAPIALPLSGDILQGIVKTVEGENASVYNLQGRSNREVMEFLVSGFAGEAASLARNEIALSTNEQIEQMNSESVTSDLAKIEGTLDGSDLYKDISSELTKQVFKKTLAFFKRPNMKKFTRITSDLLIEKEHISTLKKEGLKEKIYAMLQEKGVTLEEIEAEEEAFQEMLTQCENETYELLKKAGRVQILDKQQPKPESNPQPRYPHTQKD